VFPAADCSDRACAPGPAAGAQRSSLVVAPLIGPRDVRLGLPDDRVGRMLAGLRQGLPDGKRSSRMTTHQARAPRPRETKIGMSEVAGGG